MQAMQQAPVAPDWLGLLLFGRDSNVNQTYAHAGIHVYVHVLLSMTGKKVKEHPGELRSFEYMQQRN